MSECHTKSNIENHTQANVQTDIQSNFPNVQSGVQGHSEHHTMMYQRHVLKSKIAYAKVTQTELYYVGSITIDQTIMAQAALIAHERVQVVNLNNGERLETYVIPGEPGSGCFALNGPAARLAYVGDPIFILSYAWVSAATILTPIVVDLQHDLHSNTMHEE